MSNKTLRINKYLSQMGIASRRKADLLVEKGRVSVNGQVVKQLGLKIDPAVDLVSIDDEPVNRKSPKKTYYMLYKPRNVMTTLSDPEKRPCVGDILPQLQAHVFPVGRLDFDAEGLLLLTNQGDLAHQMLHPKFHVTKTYLVKIKGHPSPETIQKIKRGIKLEDGFIKPEFVKVDKILKENAWVKITISQGRKHLVKRIWQRFDHPVIRLIRTAFGPLQIKSMKPGQIRKLTKDEIELIESLGAQH